MDLKLALRPNKQAALRSRVVYTESKCRFGSLEDQEVLHALELPAETSRCHSVDTQEFDKLEQGDVAPMGRKVGMEDRCRSKWERGFGTTSKEEC
jgi:hypothetical protein